MLPQNHCLKLLVILTFLTLPVSVRAVPSKVAASTPRSTQAPTVKNSTAARTYLASTPTTVPSDILDGQGQLNPDAYRAIAANYGTDAGIAYRYGPDYSSYHQTPEQFPTYWKPQDQHFDNHGNGTGWDYEVGGPQDASKNDYSSNMAQVLYVADTSDDHGVDSVFTLQMVENTFSEKPQLPWVYYGGGHPEFNLLHDDWIQANGGPITQPVALGRSYGYETWGAEDLMAFNSGFIGTAGSNTADNGAYLKLPPNKVPTAVTVTNNNEFALVTIWDTQALKGQVAVLALGTGNNFWSDWKELYPGLRNRGLFSFVKVLGYVDLPGMVAPTEISASSDYRVSGDNQGWLTSPDSSNGHYTEGDLTLSDETNRQSFITGPNKNSYSKAGFAVVISKSEHKAAFLDLKPLFQKIQAMYFTTQDTFQKTQDVGQASTQWPYTFDVAPDFSPQVIKVVKLADKPTAVRTSLGDGVNRAYIATANGKLSIYSVGGYGDGASASPAAIQSIGSVKVGNNPTCIAYAKNHYWGTPDTIDNQLIVVSRGDRKIVWVNLSGNSGTVSRTLRDSRMLDPIWAEDNDNHGTESYLLSVTDYSGKQLLNYRYGPVIFHTNGGAQYGMGPNMNSEFEFGGAYQTTGRPFQASGANVP